MINGKSAQRRVQLLCEQGRIAGDEEILWRYYKGKERLEKVFGLEVVEMPHTLKGTDNMH